MEYLRDYVPILLLFIVVFGFIVVNIAATHLLGPKRTNKKKLEAFECGYEVEGNARTPFHVKYFLVAILFVLFDVEVIFMYPWVVNFEELGWIGFIEMMTFLAFLLVGFVYIVRKGALKWES
ncbi:MAG TPA: NADH-quinone oxidoreductase subunit A [Chitinophagales bacterium]|nr:NADH-quinone oxidoreductase subunit A [Chitinophagales bacterium]